MSGSSWVFMTCLLCLWRVQSPDVMWRHVVTWPKLSPASQISEMWLGSKYAMRKICWLISYFERFQFNVLHRFSLEYLVIFRSSWQIFEIVLNTFQFSWSRIIITFLTVSNSKCLFPCGVWKNIWVGPKLRITTRDPCFMTFYGQIITANVFFRWLN